MSWPVGVLLEYQTRAWGASVGEVAGTATVFQVVDETGDVSVSSDAHGCLVVALGWNTRSRLSAVECGLTVASLANRAAGESRSRRLTARLGSRNTRAAAGRAQGSSAPRESLDVRLARVSASLDSAKVAVEAARQSEGRLASRTAGRRDRVWVEARQGFILQLLIDENHYATCPIDGLASTVTACLAEAMEPWIDDELDTALSGEVEGD